MACTYVLGVVCGVYVCVVGSGRGVLVNAKHDPRDSVECGKCAHRLLHPRDARYANQCARKVCESKKGRKK